MEQWFDIMQKMPQGGIVVRVQLANGIITRGIWKRPYWYGAEGEWPAPFADVAFWQHVPAKIAAEEKAWSHV